MNTKKPLTKDEEIAKLKDQVKLLFKVADKKRLSRFGPKEEEPMKIKITLWNNVPVIEWKNIKDVVIPKAGEIFEDQITELTLNETEKGDDGKERYKTVQVKLHDFYRQLTKVACEVEEVGTSKTGVYYTVDYNGEKLKIEQTFIN